MANRIKIARGSQNNLPAALTPDSLLYGELYWAKAQTGVSDGVLYMGHSDGVEDGTHDKAPMPVAGARAMKSLYFEGLHDPSSGAYPTGAIVGSFWIASADGTGAASTFHYGDWMICIVVNPNGSTQWIKSINQAITTTGLLNKTIASATSTQVVDSIPIATYGAAHWLVCVKNGTTGRYASEIVAVDMGTGTTVDYAEYGIVQIGTFTTAPTFTVTSDSTSMILTFVGDAANSIVVNRQAV